MNYPHMLIMRASTGGCIWQAYEVRNDQERNLISESATKNGFHVSEKEQGYTEETTPGWRESQEWQDRLAGKLSPRAAGFEQSKAILKNIRRDGPYWLGGYDDWLVSCYSLRNAEDFHGYTPIACWSELSDKQCKQWMILKKDGAFYVDKLFGGDSRCDYGLKPVPIESIDYPPHIYDWIFKDIIPNHIP